MSFLKAGIWSRSTEPPSLLRRAIQKEMKTLKWRAIEWAIKVEDMCDVTIGSFRGKIRVTAEG